VDKYLTETNIQRAEDLLEYCKCRNMSTLSILVPFPPLGHVKECSPRLGKYCLRGKIDPVKQLLFLYKNNEKLYYLSVIPTVT